MECFELQPLRIQGGWKVEYNNFTEFDIEIHGTDNVWQFLGEDLLRLSLNDKAIIIDLGWYYDGEDDGRYILEMVKDYNWECPLEILETKSKKDIIAHIEKWVCHGYYSRYI